MEIDNLIADNKNLIKLTSDEIDNNIDQFIEEKTSAKCSLLQFYSLFLQKEKLIYFNMNKLILNQSMLNGNIWCPQCKSSEMFDALFALQRFKPHLSIGTIREITHVPANVVPPTYIKTNDFTWCF